MLVNALPFHPIVIASLHLGNIGPDDFICIGLIALTLVVVTFVVRGGEKEDVDKSPQSGSGASAEK
jgi:hypothetical protein